MPNDAPPIAANAAVPLLEGLTGDRPAIVEQGRVTSAEAIRERALALARWFIEQGVAPGDRTVLLAPPGADFAAALLGLVWIGAAPVLLETDQPQPVYQSRIAACRPAWIVVSPAIRWIWRLPPAAGWLRARGLPLPDAPTTGQILTLPSSGWGAPRGEAPPVPRAPDDEALILFTSGTTSAPRGIVHTHGNLPAFLHNVTRAVDGLQLESYLAETPQQIFYALLLGATCYLARGRGDRRRQNTLGILEREPIHAWFGSPWTWASWLDSGAPIPAELETILLGSSPVTRPFLRRLIERLPARVKVRCVYGLSETGPAFLADGREKAERDSAGDWVGRAVPGVEARLEDDEVLLAGPSIAGRYLGGEPTRPWLRTGDLGKLDGDGLTLIGRRKDMILRRSINLYPGLYEPLLLERLEEAALIGVFDEEAHDERVVLVYRGALPSDLVQLLGEAAPDYCLPVDALPRRGRQNKLDRTALRSLARARLQIPGGAPGGEDPPG